MPPKSICTIPLVALVISPICDLKPFVYSTASIGVVLFQISHTNRENQLKPPITSLSKNALSWAGRSRNLTWSPHDVMVRQNLTNTCTNLSQYWTRMQRECLFYWVDELKLLWNPGCLPFTQTTQVEILCINIYYSDANSPAFGRRLTLFCLISRSPALVHKSPAFYVRYKYWILSKKLHRLSLRFSPFLAKNLTFSYSQYGFWGIFARI